MTRDEERVLFDEFAAAKGARRRYLRGEILERFSSVATGAVSKYRAQPYYADLLQEASMGVLESIDRFDPSSGNRFNTYASRRAHGKAQDFLRAYGSTIKVPRGCKWKQAFSLGAIEDSEGGMGRVEPAVVHDFGDDGLSEAVQVAVEGLPGNQRRVIIGCYFEGKTLTEVGRELGVSESRAWQLRKKAIRGLKFSTMKDFA